MSAKLSKVAPSPRTAPSPKSAVELNLHQPTDINDEDDDYPVPDANTNPFDSPSVPKRSRRGSYSGGLLKKTTISPIENPHLKYVRTLGTVGHHQSQTSLISHSPTRTRGRSKSYSAGDGGFGGPNDDEMSVTSINSAQSRTMSRRKSLPTRSSGRINGHKKRVTFRSPLVDDKKDREMSIIARSYSFDRSGRSLQDSDSSPLSPDQDNSFSEDDSGSGKRKRRKPNNTRRSGYFSSWLPTWWPSFLGGSSRGSKKSKRRNKKKGIDSNSGGGEGTPPQPPNSPANSSSNSNKLMKIANNDNSGSGNGIMNNDNSLVELPAVTKPSSAVVTVSPRNKKQSGGSFWSWLTPKASITT